MITSTLILATLLVGQTQLEPAHAQNSVFKLVLDEGLESGGQKVALPKPRLVDGQDAEAQRAALREAAGSDRRSTTCCETRSPRPTSSRFAT